jgi:hypothetical protein
MIPVLTVAFGPDFVRVILLLKVDKLALVGIYFLLDPPVNILWSKDGWVPLWLWMISIWDLLVLLYLSVLPWLSYYLFILKQYYLNLTIKPILVH